MGDAAWKAFERRVAKDFGGKRRGPDTGGARGGKTDIIHPLFAVECKLLSRIGGADVLNAAIQAETNAEDSQLPIAVLKKKRASMNDAVVAMRYQTFIEWFVSLEEGEN